MVEATSRDKELIVKILSRSFEGNMSVNYLIPQEPGKIRRIRELIAYSFEMCMLWGKVVISENRMACALVIFPDRKRTTLRSLLVMGRLIIKSIGFQNVGKALSRESKVYAHHPATPIYHLWFLGVLPEYQGKGTGSELLVELLEDAAIMDRPVYLETSTQRNIPWYQKHGFSTYGRIQLSYTLSLMRSDP